VRTGVQQDRIVVTGIGPILAENAYPERFRKKRNIEGPFVLFLGQHFLYKGFSHLLDAAKIVWKKFPETNFVFVGPPVKNSESFFSDRQDPRIHRLGIVDLQEKTDALAACELLCVPSTQESFGGVYTEAWSFRKPVIGCKIPAVSEVIDDQVNGLLVEQNAADIAEKIVYLFEHPGIAESLGHKGKQKLQSRYTWDRLAELSENAYLSIL
jgi:glycosyltransferase involved in cell wall biosynthesis